MQSNIYSFNNNGKKSSKLDKRKLVIRICAGLGAVLMFGTFCISLFLR